MSVPAPPIPPNPARRPAYGVRDVLWNEFEDRRVRDPHAGAKYHHTDERGDE